MHASAYLRSSFTLRQPHKDRAYFWELRVQQIVTFRERRLFLPLNNKEQSSTCSAWTALAQRLDIGGNRRNPITQTSTSRFVEPPTKVSELILLPFACFCLKSHRFQQSTPDALIRGA